MIAGKRAPVRLEDVGDRRSRSALGPRAQRCRTHAAPLVLVRELEIFLPLRTGTVRAPPTTSECTVWRWHWRTSPAGSSRLGFVGNFSPTSARKSVSPPRASNFRFQSRAFTRQVRVRGPVRLALSLAQTWFCSCAACRPCVEREFCLASRNGGERAAWHTRMPFSQSRADSTGVSNFW